MNNSYKIAIGVSVAFILWMTAGLLKSDDANIDSNGYQDSSEGNSTSNIILVEAQTTQSQLVTSYVVAQGSLTPNREVTLKAETAGQVNQLIALEGSYVTTGDEILSLKMDDRAIRKEQATLKVAEQQRRFDAVERVQARGFASETDLDTALVELKMAEVELAKIELEIEKTVVRAPFNGIIEAIDVDLGDYVNIGNDLLTIVDNNPLVVNIYVSQKDVDYLDISTPIRVSLVNNRETTGQIRFISPRADAATRTFRVEVTIPNPEGLRAGSSVTAYVPKEQVTAHYLSAGLLTLNDAGEVGIKTADEEGMVSFYPITIELSDSEGMWVSGLPERVNVITAGQGFAPIGERVSVSLISNRNEINGGDTSTGLSIQ